MKKAGELGPVPAGMLRPFAISGDCNKRMWACENDHEPKRYSVWNPDGLLYKEDFSARVALFDRRLLKWIAPKT
jgi:hypothetical protein